jgi:hypothetical protein
MFIKNSKTKSSLFNFGLNKSFDNKTLSINKEDLMKSLRSVHLLTEYIRYCYFDNYSFKNKHNLTKYCRLLLQFELSNHPILIKSCREATKKLLNDVRQSKTGIQSVDLCFELRKSNYDDISNEAETLIDNACGTYVRGVSF